MRAVHDILYDARPGKAPGPFALIQHGTEDAYEYEIICPWCAGTVGDRVVFTSEDPFTEERLVDRGKEIMKLHMSFCTADGRKARVYKTSVPLGTEEKPKVM